MNMLTRLKQSPKRLAVLISLGLLVLAVAIPATAMAATSSATVTKCDAKDVKCVITFGDKIIADRQAKLSDLSARVTKELNAKHISSDEANALQADITTNQNGLTTLKTQLDAETDAKAARTDIKNVYEQLRIYAVVLPRDERQLHLDIERTLHDKMASADALAKIADKIAKAPSADQAQLNTLFADYKAQLADSETQIDAAQQGLSTLTPAAYNTNRATYEASLAAIHKAEVAAHNDLHKAASDLHQISTILKKK